MKKNRKSPTKKEQTSKRTGLQRPVQRKTKEVLAELVEKLRGRLELKATPASLGEPGQRPELRPNLDRLTEGVDLGDQWSHYCILGLEGERWKTGGQSCSLRRLSPTSTWSFANSPEVIKYVPTAYDK